MKVEDIEKDKKLKKEFIEYVVLKIVDELTHFPIEDYIDINDRFRPLDENIYDLLKNFEETRRIRRLLKYGKKMDLF